MALSSFPSLLSLFGRNERCAARLEKRAGAIHSLLAITVGSSESDAHTYVLEKAAVARRKLSSANDSHGAASKPVLDDAMLRREEATDALLLRQEEAREEATRNGVHLSDWLEVAPNIAHAPRAVLAHDELRQGLTMRQLREIALNTGPYDVIESNCHHAVLAVFNACAIESRKEPRIPNHRHVAIMRVLKRRLGIDVTNSEASVARSGSTHNSQSSARAASTTFYSPSR